MNRIENQHYVSRFYLKNFSINDKVFVFDKSNNKTFFSNIKNVANENYFYDDPVLDKITGKNQFLEKYFHPLETNTAKYILKLIEELDEGNFSKLDKNYRAHLSLYLTYQLLRTKETREQYRQTILIISKTLSKIHLESLGIKDKDYKIHSDEAYLQAKMILNRDFVEEIANVLNKHIWQIVVNNTQISFYTSDHPVVKRAHINDPFRSYEGLMSPGLEISFPINQKYLLLLAERTFFNNLAKSDGKILISNDPRNIIYFNSLQVSRSYRQIYSKDDDFTLAKEMLKDHPELRNKERKRIIVANEPFFNSD